MIGIVFPMKFEAQGVVARLREPRRRHRGDVLIWDGPLDGVRVTVGTIGMGRWRSEAGVRTFIEAVRPERLVLAGFCGALDPRLRRGDVCVVDDLETIYSSKRVITSVEERRRLHSQTGCTIVTMECRHVALVAERLGVPLTVIRAVSDDAARELPADLFARMYNYESGELTPARLLLHLARHPLQLLTIRETMASMPEVRDKLTDAVVRFVKQSAG